MPMAVYTFLESFDFSGKTILPLCTNEGSGMGSSEREIKKTCPGADVKKGLPITGSAAASFTAALEENLVPAANGVAEGDFTGSLTTPEGGKITNLEGRLSVEAPQVQDPNALVLDANNMGYCQHCKTVVQWKAAGTTGLSTMSDGAHHHLYMTANFDRTWGYVTLTGGTKLCLHLNGHNIQQRGRILVASSQLSIMGSGKVASIEASTNNDMNSGAITSRKSTVTLYGGTYESPVAGIPAVKLEYAEDQLLLLGGNVTGTVQADKGAVILGGNGNAADLQISEAAKLTVQADWTGTAKVTFAAALAEGKVPAANGASEGAFTGKLTVGEVKLIGKEGRLEAASAA
jgi:hypothetical protein